MSANPTVPVAVNVCGQADSVSDSLSASQAGQSDDVCMSAVCKSWVCNQECTYPGSPFCYKIQLRDHHNLIWRYAGEQLARATVLEGELASEVLCVAAGQVIEGQSHAGLKASWRRCRLSAHWAAKKQE